MLPWNKKNYQSFLRDIAFSILIESLSRKFLVIPYLTLDQPKLSFMLIFQFLVTRHALSTAWKHLHTVAYISVYGLRMPIYGNLSGEIRERIQALIELCNIEEHNKIRYYFFTAKPRITCLIFPYTVSVCLYMEVIYPNTVKYGNVFKRLLSFII